MAITLKAGGLKDAKLLYLSGMTVAEMDIPFGSEVSLKPGVDTIDFEGDDQTDRMYINQKLEVDVKGMKISTEVLAKLTNTSIVSSGLPSSAQERVYFGTSQEVSGLQLGLKADVSALDDSDGSSLTVRIWVFKGLTGPVTVAPASKKALDIAFQLSAQKTSTDLAGDALPGVPTGGALWALDVI